MPLPEIGRRLLFACVLTRKGSVTGPSPGQCRDHRLRHVLWDQAFSAAVATAIFSAT